MAVMTREFNRHDLSDPVKAAEYVKRKALEFGADAVGIGNIERWSTAPLQMDPKQIMPECKSIIGMVFRVERGSLRGVEERCLFQQLFRDGIRRNYLSLHADDRHQPCQNN